MTMAAICTLSLALTLSSHVAQHHPADDPDMKELAGYTLTLDTLSKVDRAMHGLADAMKADQKYADLIKVHDELAALNDKDQRTEAEDKRIEELEAREEELSNKVPDMSANADASLSDMAAAIQRFPPMAVSLQKQGLTARDFAKFTLALFQASMAVSLQSSGMLKQVPEGTNPANITFVREHHAELQKLQASWASLGK